MLLILSISTGHHGYRSFSLFSFSSILQFGYQWKGYTFGTIWLLDHLHIDTSRAAGLSKITAGSFPLAWNILDVHTSSVLAFASAPSKQKHKTEKDHTQEAEAAHCRRHKNGSEVQHHPDCVMLCAIDQGAIVIRIKDEAVVGIESPIPKTHAFDS